MLQNFTKRTPPCKRCFDPLPLAGNFASPKATPDKAILPDFLFFFPFFLSRADRPHVPHFPFFWPHFAVFPVFAACPGLARMFRIFYGLNMRKIGMTDQGWVGVHTSNPPKNPPTHLNSFFKIVPPFSPLKSAGNGQKAFSANCFGWVP